MDSAGQLTGSDITFLYPDLKTGITGTYRSGRLVCGNSSLLILCSSRNNMYELKMKKISTKVMKFEPGTSNKICDYPLLPDPYESTHVFVDNSKSADLGEGLFVHEFTPANTVLSFYNGIRLSTDTSDRDEHWENDAYKILDLTPADLNGNEGIIDIPPEYRDIDAYRASLAHKANHSFLPNAKYALFYHPRFGLVPSVRSICDIAAGREVLVNYEYSPDEAPPWYSDAYTSQIFKKYQQSKQEYGWR